MQRLAWKQQRERVLVCIDKWPARLRGGGDDLGDVDRLELEVDLALGDARYVEQIVDQAHELLQLTADDVLCPRELRGIDIALLQHVHGVGDRRKRVAQLVREHRQKLVLAPVLLVELPVQQGIVERDCGAARKVGRHRNQIGIEAASRRAHGQRQRAQGPAAREEWQHDQRLDRGASRRPDRELRF